MKTKPICFFSALSGLLLLCTNARADELQPLKIDHIGVDLAVAFLLFLLLIIAVWLYRLSRRLREEADAIERPDGQVREQLTSLNRVQIDQLINHSDVEKKPIKRNGRDKAIKALTIAITLVLSGHAAKAQDASVAATINSPGIYIMLVLVMLPLIGLVYIACVKLSRIVNSAREFRLKKQAVRLTQQMEDDEEFFAGVLRRKRALDYTLNDSELAGNVPPDDKKGLLTNVAEVNGVRFISPKRRAAKKHNVDPKLVKLILWFLCTGTFWLVAGTSIGEYIGIKFVSPDADHVSWLSFGRLRPTHTNMVFWGWSSLAMIGLGHYVVTTVSNTVLYSTKWGYYTLILINSAVLCGTISLMAGINNGGGEYREYTWPVMGLFALGIVITLINFLKTIARRKTPEIYISNWYIVSSVMFLTVIVIVGYVPWWQNGLGETIVQGFYMHQAVGMWFMLFNLGLVYYFLPQHLNTPIYSYSLGILAFWSQILFYTLIGTHHFLFSSIPWWLQTVAIVGSVGMLIPVFAGTTNFLMTIRGNYHKISRSYTLPFYVTGIIFYFTGSTQGTAEAFRSTNLVWHFTDFTVAHSHITMYGIIAFMLWACIYTLVPRLTGKEAKQSLVGAHFWMALVGILFYSIPLMVGGTLKGMGWVAGKPFIDGVSLMAPYWLWRAIGGSLMWGSHLLFAWNMYAMTVISTEAEVQAAVFEKLDYLPANATI
ncbi:cytochrome oxidase subunit I [Mucilaginibacter terrenus]|uniref:Cytochrome oxidase subunit I n=2 Tax=Mucilaginibacter terrenus TaxID=2482727 RepID=A0A3E2NYJ0_9SPHI|nr:cytochrome oxidase subunit I [Mucilaginibacter terrenus]